jgi:transmembrane sensor
MEELFRKYLDSQCSPGEVKQLLAYFNEPGNELLLRGLIKETLANSDDAEDGSQWQPATDEIFVQIKNQIKPRQGGLTFFFRKTWVRVAAAAILLIGSFLAYNLVNNTGIAKQEIAKTDTTSDEVHPGGNKAILTLADGSNVTLEAAGNGTITTQGNTTLIKPADGQLTYTSLPEKPAQILLNNVTTPKGGQYQLTLSDGSKVWLNAASSIHFPVVFTGPERNVEITGEAYFEVAKNAAMPFKVKIAGKAEVEVLGTHFNISAYSDEPAINTTLLEGSVKVTGHTPDVSRIIVPGEQAQLNTYNQIVVNKHPNVEQVIAWKNGIFNFDNADLETSLRQIARWYNVDLVFEGAIPQKQFNGEMQQSLSIAQVIKLLGTNNVHCRLDGRKLVVMK